MAKSKKTTGAKASAKGKSGKTAAKSSAKGRASKNTGKTSSKGSKLALKNTNSAKVVEYKLFCEDSVRSLEDQVNYHISKGWSPVGGVVLQGQHNYLQTMVRQDI
ncbi:MAG: hypothetical protein NTX25_19715 [Proteobacteria bacterium]|nr:hypothetical protein [Pseudomonadota bacterium]